MPPYVVLRDFLDDGLIAGLLDLAVTYEADFVSTQIVGDGVDFSVRKSLALRNLKDFGPTLRAKFGELAAELVARLRATPIAAPHVVVELVAHNDGAFFKRHVDTMTEKLRTATAAAYDRKHLIAFSGVCYFHAQPKAFSGGALRLYAIGDPQNATYVDIEPAHNSLVFFPSWAPHEVMPVSCPSGRFIDSRFAINCWVYRPRQEAPRA